MCTLKVFLSWPNAVVLSSNRPWTGQIGLHHFRHWFFLLIGGNRCEIYHMYSKKTINWYILFVILWRQFTKANSLFRLLLVLRCVESIFCPRFWSDAKSCPGSDWINPNFSSNLPHKIVCEELWANATHICHIAFWDQNSKLWAMWHAFGFHNFTYLQSRIGQSQIVDVLKLGNHVSTIEIDVAVPHSVYSCSE